MNWITRARVKVDRVACPWLIKKFVDPDAEFFFVPADQVMAEAERLAAIPFDVKDVELGHHGQECSFEAILKKYDLTGNPALVLLGKIVNGADTDNTLRFSKGARLQRKMRRLKKPFDAQVAIQYNESRYAILKHYDLPCTLRTRPWSMKFPKQQPPSTNAACCTCKSQLLCRNTPKCAFKSWSR